MFFEQWKNKWLYWVSPPISSTVYLYITEWRKNAKKYFDPLRSKSEKKSCVPQITREKGSVFTMRPKTWDVKKIENKIGM